MIDYRNVLCKVLVIKCCLLVAVCEVRAETVEFAPEYCPRINMVDEMLCILDSVTYSPREQQAGMSDVFLNVGAIESPVTDLYIDSQIKLECEQMASVVGLEKYILRQMYRMMAEFVCAYACQEQDIARDALCKAIRLGLTIETAVQRERWIGVLIFLRMEIENDLKRTDARNKSDSQKWIAGFGAALLALIERMVTADPELETLHE